MLSWVWQTAEEIWIRLVDEKWIKKFRFPPYHPKMVHLERYDLLTSYSDAVLNPHYQRVHLFVSKEKVIHPHNMGWKTASAKQIFYLAMFDGSVAVKVGRMHSEGMSCQDIEDLHSMRNSVELMCDRYPSLESFADPMRFPEKLFEDAGFLGTRRECRYKHL